MSASTHEAVLGGARWRLTLHPDGRWDVAKMLQRCWTYVISGNDGLAGMRDAATVLRPNSLDWIGPETMSALADVAERSTTP